MAAGRVLLVDTPGSALWALAARLRHDGFDVVEASDIETTRAGLSDGPDVVLVHLPAVGEVSSLVAVAAEADPAPAVFGVAADESHRSADPRVYLATFVLPVDPETVARRAAREIEVSGLRRQLRAVRRASGPLLGLDAIVGDSPGMRHVRDTVAKLAASAGVPVLISGEAGVGRRHVARVLHDAGAQGSRPLVRFDCAAPGDHADGLFGSATDEGAWTAAADTTLVLEAIDRLPATAQATLADLLRHGPAVTRWSGSRGASPARLVATTTDALEDLVERGTFRRDLYYSVNVARVALLPLRDRGRDIVELAGHFASTEGRAPGVADAVLDESAANALMAYSWPGNVGELRDVIRLALTRASGGMVTDAVLAIPPGTRGGPGPCHLPEGGVDLEALERQLVHEAVARTGGNLTRAAALVGLSRDQVRYRLQKYGPKSGVTGRADDAGPSR